MVAGFLVVLLRLISWLKNKHAKECLFVTERCLSRITELKVSIERGETDRQRGDREVRSESLSRRALPLSRRSMILSLSIPARTLPINLSISTFGYTTQFSTLKLFWSFLFPQIFPQLFFSCRVQRKFLGTGHFGVSKDTNTAVSPHLSDIKRCQARIFRIFTLSWYTKCCFHHSLRTWAPQKALGQTHTG